MADKTMSSVGKLREEFPTAAIRFSLAQIGTVGGRPTLHRDVDWHIEPDTDERMEAMGRKKSIREKRLEMKYSRWKWPFGGAWVGLIFALSFLAWAFEATTQVERPGTPVSIRGKVLSLKDSELMVAGPSGEVKVSLADKTVIRGEVAIRLSDITPGMYLGTTATKQANGGFLASEVHVFSEDQRGTGEGHRPLGSAPQSGATMTNANVERVEDVVVRDVKGRVMNLKYRGGEINVLVPPDIPLVKRILGDRSLLKPGAGITVTATQGADGSLTASQITVRAPAK